MNRSSRAFQWSALALVVTAGMCGRHSSDGFRSSAPLIAEVHDRFDLPLRDEARRFVVDFGIPRGYDRIGEPRLGELRWYRDRNPTIELRVNPTADETTYDAHRPCRFPQLEVPLLDGRQAACFSSSGYHVTRLIRFDSEVLRCSVRSDGRDLERLGEAWALCADLRAQRVTPTLTTAKREAFSFVDRGAIYDVEVSVPLYYTSASVGSYDGSDESNHAAFKRGRNEPRIDIRLNEHIRTQQLSGFSWQDRPCRVATGLGLRRRVPRTDGSISWCRYRGGPWAYEDADSIVRFVEVGSDVVSCEVSSPGYGVSIDVLERICDSMTVTRRHITW